MFAGCANYRIPIQTCNHPASSNAAITQIELSSILELSDTTENNENYDSIDY